MGPLRRGQGETRNEEQWTRKRKRPTSVSHPSGCTLLTPLAVPAAFHHFTRHHATLALGAWGWR
jgi:hypothetical protein